MVEHHTWTGLLLLFAGILSGLCGTFFIFSQADVTKIPEHDAGDDKLRSASSNLLIAYVLAFVATGLLLVLSLVYFLQGSLNWNEITHTIIFILIFVLLVISIIFGFIALSDIDESGVADKKNSVGWLWGAFGVAIGAILLVIFSGAWRYQHVQSKKSQTTVETSKTALTFTSPPQAGSPSYNYNTSYVAGPSTVPNYPAPALPMTPGSSPVYSPPGARSVYATSTYEVV